MYIRKNIISLNEYLGVYKKKIFFCSLYFFCYFYTLIVYTTYLLRLNMGRFYDYQICCTEVNTAFACSTFPVYNINETTFARERKGFLYN